MSKTMIPQLRVKKSGNKHKDDLRVLMAGIILCIVMIFGQNVYPVFQDRFLSERPFIVASTLEIVHVDKELEPLILYNADPNQNVSGTWIASVYTADGTHLTSRRGHGNYLAADDKLKFWSWSAWFDNEQSDPPAIPTEPFYVCVRYEVIANDSGVHDSGKPFCSNVYDPTNPTKSITITQLLGDVRK